MHRTLLLYQWILYLGKNGSRKKKMLAMLKHLPSTSGQCKSKNAWVNPSPSQKHSVYHTVPVDSIPKDCSSICSANVLKKKREGPKGLHFPLRYRENKGGVGKYFWIAALKILWSWEQLILFHVSSIPYPIFIMYWSQWSGIHWASPPIQTLRYQQNQNKGGKELESNPLRPAFFDACIQH